MRNRRLAGPGAERRSWRLKALLYRHLSTLLLSVSCGLLAIIPFALAANWLILKSHSLEDLQTNSIGFLIGFLPVIAAQKWLHKKTTIYRLLIISASILAALSTGLLGWCAYKHSTHVPSGILSGLGYIILAILAACGGGIAIMLFVAAALGGRSRRMLAQLPTLLQSPAR